MILGIDPGLANVGYAVLSPDASLLAHGHIETKRGKGRGDTNRRLREILRQLKNRTAGCADSIQTVVIEWPGGAGGVNAQSVLQTIACAGFLAGFFLGRERLVLEPAPQTWRTALGGKRATEEHVHDMIMSIGRYDKLRLLTKKALPHVLDAVGLARYGLMLTKEGP